MLNLTTLAGFFTALAISLLTIPSIVKIARKRGLYGIRREKGPDTGKIPVLGGMAIFAALIISLNLYSDAAEFPALPFLTTGTVVLFFIGLKDDILTIAPWWKLSAQLLVALVVSGPGGIRIMDPGQFIGLGTSGEVVEISLTVLFIIILINAYNLIDGIDGLAAAIGILGSLVFGVVFYRAGLQEWFLAALIYCGSLAGFARYNLMGRKNKIYLGDSGSLFLGFILAVMAVRFLNIEGGGIGDLQIRSPLAFMMAVLIVPLFDIFRIVVVRIFQGRSPLRPDRQHIHYRLVDAGLSHAGATGILVLANGLMITVVLVFQGFGEIPVILILLALCVAGSVLPGYYIRKRKRLRRSTGL